MSNGPRLGLRQELRVGHHLEQRLGVSLAPLMTPVVRPPRSPGAAPAEALADEPAPWRRSAPRRR
jgi:hypothetical protein